MSFPPTIELLEAAKLTVRNYVQKCPTARDSERVDEPIKGVSLDLFEERVKANLEPLNEQISTLAPLLNQLL